MARTRTSKRKRGSSTGGVRRRRRVRSSSPAIKPDPESSATPAPRQPKTKSEKKPKKETPIKKEKGTTTTSSPQKQNRKKRLSIDEVNRFELRFGETEIIALYTGGEQDGDANQFRFVRLCHDIFYDDDGKDLARVDWLEETNVEVGKGRTKKFLRPSTDEDGEEEEPDLVPIDSLICAVTDRLVPRSDGSFDLPNADTLEYVKKRLERQLDDDYDPSVAREEDDGGLDFEKRMRRSSRRKVRDVIVLDDDTDEEDDDGEPKPKRAKREGVSGRKKKTSRKSPAAKGRGKKKALTPRPEIEVLPDIWHGKKTGKINAFNGDTHRASKEPIRAYLSKDTAAFKKILKDSDIVADLFMTQSPDVELNVLHYAILAEDRPNVKILWDELKDNKNQLKRPKFPDITLLQLSSGRHTSAYADYNRHQVGASRGGAEGNNAFTADMKGGRSYGTKRTNEPSSNEIVDLMQYHDELSIPFIDYLDKEFFSGNFVDWSFDFHKLVVFGCRAFAERCMRLLLDRGVGLNKLHVESLGTAGADSLESFRAISVTKLSQNGVRFMPVHCAASNPDPSYLKKLLEVAPEAINCLDSFEGTLLHYAAVGERPDTLSWLLSGPGSTLNRNARLRKGAKTTPLMWAAQAARPENINLLCNDWPEKDAMFTTKDASGRTALHLAVSGSKSARLKTVGALLECGADPNVKGDARLFNKQTPVMVCAARGDLELLEILVEKGGDLALGDKLGRTCAMFAAKNGHVHILSYLLRAGVDVDTVDSSNNTAMHYAAAYGWVECIELLLEAGANPDPKNSWSSTPLALALKKGRYACAVVLLNLEGSRVNVNVFDKTGLSLFNSLVVSYMDQLKSNSSAPVPWAIEKILGREDLDLELGDASGRTVLHHISIADISSPTARGKVVELSKKLISLGADPLLKDDNGTVAAQSALKNCNLELCILFLNHESHDCVGQDGEGRNLMHLLVKNIATVSDEKAFLEVFDVLEKCNKEWDFQVDDLGMTPLLLAADSFRRGYSSNEKMISGKSLLEKLLDRSKGVQTCTLDRRAEFRKWPEKRIVDGVPNWTPSQEYAKVSRSILHALVSIPDVVWVEKMLCKEIGKFGDGSTALGHILGLKENGKDVVNLAVDRFVQICSVSFMEPTVKIFKLLHEKGANMNGITHPLFASLDEAQNIGGSDVAMEELDLSDEGHRLKNAFSYVLERERKYVREQLAKKKKGLALKEQFQPLLQRVLDMHSTSSSFKGLLHGMLAECGLLCDVRDIDGNTALHHAICRNQVDVVKELLQHPSVDVNTVNGSGDSPLILAAYSVEITKILLDNGAEVDYVSPVSGTALHRAVENYNEEVVGLLLKTCNADASDSKGRTPLHLAIAKSAVSKREMLNPIEMQLLSAGADVNAADASNRTPLHYAFFSTNVDTKCVFPPSKDRDPIDMLTTLSGKGNIKLDVADEDGRTPLHYAASVGASICVLYLCENSDDSMNALDEDANTPLALALRAHRAETAVLLISKGSKIDIMVTDVERKKKDGMIIETRRNIESAIWHALDAKGSCESVARYMLAAKKLSEDTILSALFATGNFQLAMQHIRTSASREEMAKPSKRDGMTALHRLAQVKEFAPGFAIALADQLIKNGVDVSTTCPLGRTAMHIAAYFGHEELLRHLQRQHNCAVDVIDKEGGSPLTSMFAGGKPSPEVLHALTSGSKDVKALVNSFVKGKRIKEKEEKWNFLSDVESVLLDTPPEKKRDEVSFLDYIKAPPQPKKSTMYTVKSTPLIEAVRGRNVKLVNSLLSYGADGTMCDKDGRTALHHAVIEGDHSVLLRLLCWCSIPINALDRHGRSALVYAIIGSSKNPDHLSAKLLLNFGADPLLGDALVLAIRLNRQDLSLAMLQCASTELSQSKSEKNNYKAGDFVWVRFGEMSGSWYLGWVARVDGRKLSIFPSNASGRQPLQPLENEVQRRSELIDVSDEWVCKADEGNDVVTGEVGKIMLSLLGNSTMSVSEKQTLVREFAGFEVGLREKLLPLPQRDALTSILKIGDPVGFLVQNKISGTVMLAGSVVEAYQNGQYDVQLMRGRLERLPRSDLRPLRSCLALSTCSSKKNLPSNLVHVCARPTSFGSYDNVSLFRALASAGVKADGKNAEGKTPMESAFPGSKIFDLLRDMTNFKHASNGESSHDVPIFDAIDLAADADAALLELHEAGADVTETIVPKVNPVCELDSAGVSVLSHFDGFYFDVALTKVDVEYGQYGKYVFYKMQIVHDPVQNVFVLLTNWGRIGETGKYQQTPYTDREKCSNEFFKVFKSKTGNNFTDGSFIKHPGKYNLVRLPKTRVKQPEKLLRAVVESPSLSCTLPAEVGTVLRYLLNADALTAAISRCGYNQDRLPFGQLSLSTVQAAEKKLDEIKEVLENQQKNSKNQSLPEIRAMFDHVAKLSSEFYELVPIGDDIVAPFQLNDYQFKKAVEVIDLLRDLTITKQILLGAMKHQATMNPLDYAYKALEAHIKPLEVDSIERACLQKYIDNTCTDDDVLVHQIYSINDGKTATDIPNKRLLFHGSKNENILGILKHGLLIAPPAAPSTGWNYGKGVYFADQFSKAFGYASPLNATGWDGGQPRSFIFVAEVALGESYMPVGIEYMEKPPLGMQSTLALGSKETDPSKDLTLKESGATVPLGELQKTKTPEQVKSFWGRSRYNTLEDEVSTKIEEVRLDPNTKFPAAVHVTVRGEKMKVTLEHGPGSKTAKMEPLPKEETEPDDDEDNDNVVRIHVRNRPSFNAVKIVREDRSPRSNWYSEFIVYDTQQIRLKYLVEITSKKWVKKKFHDDEEPEDDDDDDDDDEKEEYQNISNILDDSEDDDSE